jgi:hypothetical protein
MPLYVFLSFLATTTHSTQIYGNQLHQVTNAAYIVAQ